MPESDNGAASAQYHRDRARAERQAAERARDERVRHAHLGLALQHEIAMFRVHRPHHGYDSQADRDGEGRAGGGGAIVRPVIVFPDTRLAPVTAEALNE